MSAQIGRERAIAPGAHTVVRAFLFAEGGIRRRLVPGEVIATIPQARLPGLVAAGYVMPCGDPTATVVETARVKKPAR